MCLCMTFVLATKPPVFRGASSPFFHGLASLRYASKRMARVGVKSNKQITTQCAPTVLIALRMSYHAHLTPSFSSSCTALPRQLLSSPQVCHQFCTITRKTTVPTTYPSKSLLFGPHRTAYISPRPTLFHNRISIFFPSRDIISSQKRAQRNVRGSGILAFHARSMVLCSADAWARMLRALVRAAFVGGMGALLTRYAGCDGCSCHMWNA